jgi:hypothetical protein
MSFFGTTSIVFPCSIALFRLIWVEYIREEAWCFAIVGVISLCSHFMLVFHELIAVVIKTNSQLTMSLTSQKKVSCKVMIMLTFSIILISPVSCNVHVSQHEPFPTQVSLYQKLNGYYNTHSSHSCSSLWISKFRTSSSSHPLFLNRYVSWINDCILI